MIALKNHRYFRDETEFNPHKHYLPISPSSSSTIMNEQYRDDNEGIKGKSMQFVDSFEKDLKNKLSNVNQERNSVYC